MSKICVHQSILCYNNGGMYSYLAMPKKVLPKYGLNSKGWTLTQTIKRTL